MSSLSVFATRPILDAGIAELAAAGMSVSMNPLARQLSAEELCQQVGRHDGVICHLTDRIDEGVLRASLPRCKVFATCAVGYDNIDVAAAGRLGLTIANTPDVLTEATADLAWALLLATARRLGEAERVVRAGVWRGWGMLDYLGVDVFGTTLGIVGAGRIGTAVARRASGFSMTLLYSDRQPREQIEDLGARRVPLAELLETSDFVSLHTPLVEETRHLIDEKALARMQRHAVLINTSRGQVVDQVALIKTLQRGRIAGAGLDVYWDEPRLPKDLLALENVVLLPHIGSATLTTRSKMAIIAAQNVISVLRGGEALHPVTV